MSEDIKYFYRFRKLNSHTIEELENSYFYCAETNELNDPMEGFCNIVFQGDCVVWKNLFKHYFCCLLRVCLLNATSNNSNTIDLENEFKCNDFIFGDNDSFLTTMTKNILCNGFIESCQKIIDNLSNRKSVIKKYELALCLVSIHYKALSLIYNNSNIGTDIKIYEWLIEVNKIKEANNLNNNVVEDLATMMKTMLSYIPLRANTLSKNNRFILFDFIDVYLNELYKLIYPRRYLVSFTDNPNNSSLWGNYAQSHSGICLVFESKNDKIELIYTYAKQQSKRNFDFRKVNYGNKLGETEFFSNLRRYLLDDLIEMWYKDNNNISPIFSKSGIFNEEKQFEYWKNTIDYVLNKSKDWEYEREYRIVVTDDLKDKLEDNERKLFYDFNSLSGIIFGINTTNTQKAEIINLIHKKCENSGRKTFKFYQAYYCNKNGNIGYNEI